LTLTTTTQADSIRGEKVGRNVGEECGENGQQQLAKALLDSGFGKSKGKSRNIRLRSRVRRIASVRTYNKNPTIIDKAQ